MKTLRNFIFWSYERGSIQFDIMVTLILLFIFIAPHYINFRAAPVPHIPLNHSEVLIRQAGTEGTDSRFIYTIRLEDLSGAKTDAALRANMLRVIEPMSGYVTLESYKPITDPAGKLVAYEATVLR